jgi:hypothetical protein
MEKINIFGEKVNLEARVPGFKRSGKMIENGLMVPCPTTNPEILRAR